MTEYANTVLGEIDWQKVFFDHATWIEEKFNLDLQIDATILNELATGIEGAVTKVYDIEAPNTAKLAGVIVFWIRRLKPVSHAPTSPMKYLYVNELLAYIIGFSICKKYYQVNAYQGLHTRLRHDFIHSLRYHSHSPSSVAILFESLFTKG